MAKPDAKDAEKNENTAPEMEQDKDKLINDLKENLKAMNAQVRTLLADGGVTSENADVASAIKDLTELIEASGKVKRKRKLPPIQEVEPFQEQYWLVNFHTTQDPNESRDVTIGLNNRILHIKRGEDIIIPLSMILACCEHSRTPKYEQNWNKPRKVVEHVMTYPFSVIDKKKTRKDFEMMLRTGNSIQLEAVRRLERQQERQEASAG